MAAPWRCWCCSPGLESLLRPGRQGWCAGERSWRMFVLGWLPWRGKNKALEKGKKMGNNNGLWMEKDKEMGMGMGNEKGMRKGKGK